MQGIGEAFQRSRKKKEPAEEWLFIIEPFLSWSHYLKLMRIEDEAGYSVSFGNYHKKVQA
ncbi:MAG: hypothetical protein ACE362_20595 [Phaeodactylibacter xiamenensis]|uniref:Uncharacterized protein n=1 Tax=Phaeodactylibacter xiamenensis TaxID=1524460 RepID=A0A098S9M1_9BACT|nr:hypothetical protein [Phaeodactylibacter xiamenensis]KGE89289.1 hypothetical protein IX84_02850 [Phaeodactylibacter xiamenensis]MCR9055483.1 hypothetical protein [bacterium]